MGFRQSACWFMRYSVTTRSSVMGSEPEAAHGRSSLNTVAGSAADFCLRLRETGVETGDKVTSGRGVLKVGDERQTQMVVKHSGQWRAQTGHK